MWETVQKKNSRIIDNAFGKVGVFLGGKSRERRISLRSGEAVYQALKRAGLQVEKIDPANGYLDHLRSKPLDLAFLALHGTGGEDGTIQKVLERFRVPYVGSDPKASCIAFDKHEAKRLFDRWGIPTPEYEVATLRNWRAVQKRWQPPYVIKPTREGSSIGVSFVERGENGTLKLRRNLQPYPSPFI